MITLISKENQNGKENKKKNQKSQVNDDKNIYPDSGLNNQEVSEYISIATIGKPVGLDGWCRIFSFGSTLRSCTIPLTVLGGRKKPERELLLKKLVPANKGFKALFSEYVSREDVEVLKNYQVFVTRDTLPPKEENEYYHFELEGLSVFCLESNTYIGRVLAVNNYPTIDALDVKKDDGTIVVVPLSRDITKSINLLKQEIQIVGSFIQELL